MKHAPFGLAHLFFTENWHQWLGRIMKSCIHGRHMHWRMHVKAPYAMTHACVGHVKAPHAMALA